MVKQVARGSGVGKEMFLVNAINNYNYRTFNTKGKGGLLHVKD